MFIEQYILFMLQDKLEADGESEELCMGGLTKEMVERYIDRVIVYDEQNIEIQWKRRKENLNLCILQ